MSENTNKIHETITKIVREYGDPILQNRKRLAAMLSDYLPDMSKEEREAALEEIASGNVDFFAPPPSVSAPTQTAPSSPPPAPTPHKKHTMRNVLIAAGVVVAAVAAFLIVVVKPEWINPIELDENDMIIFTQKKNNDKLITGNFALKLKNIKTTQNFIKKHFPDFDFKKEGYETDDYRNELLVKEFNDNPEVMSIYLKGIEEMAGKSQVYTSLWYDEEELLLYYFSIDNEFSDRSGIEYYMGIYENTSQHDGRIGAIRLYKYLYSDTNEPYWEIEWDEDIKNKERLTLLNSFLNSLRYTKVFKELGKDFFKDMYTGIDKYQRIEDIVDWWKN
jgi:hypothetical protein